MEAVLGFLQTYGPWIALGGGMLFLMNRGGGMGCCGVPQQQGVGQSQDASSRQQARTKNADAEPTRRVTTAAEIHAHFNQLQTQQQGLERQIATLEAEVEGATTAPRAASGPVLAGSSNRER